MIHISWICDECLRLCPGETGSARAAFTIHRDHREKAGPPLGWLQNDGEVRCPEHRPRSAMYGAARPRSMGGG